MFFEVYRERVAEALNHSLRRKELNAIYDDYGNHHEFTRASVLSYR